MQDNIKATFPEPLIGVGGLLFNRKNQVLLIRRGKPPAHGLWSVPGGRLEAGETLIECCRREFKEETGLDIRVISIAAVVERRIENFHYVIVDFVVGLLDETQHTPQAASDVSEACWIDLELLDDYPIVMGLPEIIRRTVCDPAGGLHDPGRNGVDFIIPAQNPTK